MTYHSNMTSKGQVTVPKDIRDALGLEPGQAVAFEIDSHGDARILKADSVAATQRKEAEFLDRLKKAQAVFKRIDRFPDVTTDEYMAMLREPQQPWEKG